MQQYFLLALLFLLPLGACSDTDPIIPADPPQVMDEIFKGVDMSFLPEVRASGLPLFNSEGLQEDMLMTLKKAGVNVIRLRVWKNPIDATSNLATVLALSNEVKALGMKTYLTVHYSDTWADPSHQQKPVQWENLPFQGLADSVFHYTKAIMETLQPNYIQIGNEINNGFLWPDGSLSRLAQMKQLLRAGIQAVRQVNDSTQIMLHYAGTQDAVSFFDSIKDLDYDLIGLSYYPLWHGKDMAEVESQIKTLSSLHTQPIIIAETAYPFTFDWNDWTNNIIGAAEQIVDVFPATPNGQRDFMLEVRAMMSRVPTGKGFCYWGSEWISYKGTTANDGSSWENQAFWDFTGKALPVLEAYR